MMKKNAPLAAHHPGFWLVLIATLVVLLPGRLSARMLSEKGYPDTAVSRAILSRLMSPGGLQYPRSVTRFYSAGGYRLAWTDSLGAPGRTHEALLILDCVLQYGLSKTDYHPGRLSNRILDSVKGGTTHEKVRFDILMTDALLCLMNDLHYGKANQAFTRQAIDTQEGPYDAVAELLRALQSADFMSGVLSAQPATQGYRQLREELAGLLGSQAYDCDKMPEGRVRTIAVNLERQRWLALNPRAGLTINIPAFTLTDHTVREKKEYRVIVGKPSTPTPELRSLVTHFATMPEWAVPKSIWIKELLPAALKDPSFLQRNHYLMYDAYGRQVAATAANLQKIRKNPGAYRVSQAAGCDNALGVVVFRFENPYSVYLHDTPGQQLFNRAERAFSHGCIRLQQALALARSLLLHDGQPAKALRLKDPARLGSETFRLNTPVSLEVVYLTCLPGRNGLVFYPDIYGKDKALEAVLLN